MIALDEFLRDWIHETPLSLCDMGADTCPDWDLAKALAEAIKERNGVMAPITNEHLRDVTKRVASYAERRR